MSLTESNLYSTLRALDEELVAIDRESEWHLICCGGAAMLSLGMSSRKTNDIDLLQPSVSSELRLAALKVSLRIGLSEDWLNDGPKDLVSVLPHDWFLHIEQFYPDKSYEESVLRVSRLGRRDLILTKFLAHVDRGTGSVSVDLNDLLSLNPTEDELRWSAKLIHGYDINPHWDAYVDRVLEDAIRKVEKNAP